MALATHVVTAAEAVARANGIGASSIVVLRRELHELRNHISVIRRVVQGRREPTLLRSAVTNPDMLQDRRNRS